MFRILALMMTFATGACLTVVLPMTGIRADDPPGGNPELMWDSVDGNSEKPNKACNSTSGCLEKSKCYVQNFSYNGVNYLAFKESKLHEFGYCGNPFSTPSTCFEYRSIKCAEVTIFYKLAKGDNCLSECDQFTLNCQGAKSATEKRSLYVRNACNVVKDQ